MKRNRRRDEFHPKKKKKKKLPLPNRFAPVESPLSCFLVSDGNVQIRWPSNLVDTTTDNEICFFLSYWYPRKNNVRASFQREFQVDSELTFMITCSLKRKSYRNTMSSYWCDILVRINEKMANQLEMMQLFDSAMTCSLINIINFIKSNLRALFLTQVWSRFWVDFHGYLFTKKKITWRIIYAPF